MGLHSEAGLDRKFVEFAKLLTLYLNHFPRHLSRFAEEHHAAIYRQLPEVCQRRHQSHASAP